MALKVVIADKVGIKVKGTTQEESGAEKKFEFVLVCDRLNETEMKAVMGDQRESISQFFEKRVHDWRDQRLVFEEDKPAAFSVEALKLLLNIHAMPAVCWQAYLMQAGATGKN